MARPLEVPPHSVILLDELPNLLNNYNFKSMPDNLFSLLSQNRKIDIRIMATAPTEFLTIQLKNSGH